LGVLWFLWFFVNRQLSYNISAQWLTRWDIHREAPPSIGAASEASPEPISKIKMPSNAIVEANRVSITVLPARFKRSSLPA